MFSKRVKSYALTCNENELRKGKNAKSGRGLQGVLRIRKKNEMKIEPIRFDSICHWTNTFSVQFGSMLVVFLLLRNRRYEIFWGKKTYAPTNYVNKLLVPPFNFEEKEEKSERINDKWNARICFCPSHSSLSHSHVCTRSHLISSVSLFNCQYLCNIHKFRALNGKSSKRMNSSMIVIRTRPSTLLLRT